MSPPATKWLIECSRALKGIALKLKGAATFDASPKLDSLPFEIWLEIFLSDPDWFVPSRLGELRLVSKGLSTSIAPILFSKIYFNIPFFFGKPYHEYEQRLADKLGVIVASRTDNVLHLARHVVIRIGVSQRWGYEDTDLPQDEVDHIGIAAQNLATLLDSHGHHIISIQ
ncbi:hypothetical protein EST38_g6198 [Candolleomyces aberdarensis]|uniref:Uncharacterized protein n=1 Tax=Candolleomyces aberdarensis TaxID=2316362 RepID=A0A4Q2DKC7_9AGAR|nr:hypothetical protein EST38_g6198 [Candolleomyces aberdarensis]